MQAIDSKGTTPVITAPLDQIHDTRTPISAKPNLWERIAIECRSRHYSLSTERTYVHWAKSFCAWHGRRHPARMSALPSIALEVSRKRGRQDGHGALSDATVKQRLALLKAACRWAWKAHELTKHDPTTRMQMPAVRNERHVYASRQQAGQLAWAADRRDVRALILLAFYTGMRLGELQRAEVAGRTLVLADTKNGDRRAIPVHPSAVRLLKHVPFSTPKITLQRGFQRARVRAGLPHIRLHDLRHSAASEMVNAGVDLYTVGAVLGHRDARSTKRYAHLRQDTLADAVGKIGRKSPHTGKAKDRPKAA